MVSLRARAHREVLSDRWSLDDAPRSPGRSSGGWGTLASCAAAEIAALAAEQVFDALAAPIVRVTTPDVHIPFSPPLEKPLYPDKDKIAAALRRVLEGRAG